MESYPSPTSLYMHYRLLPGAVAIIREGTLYVLPADNSSSYYQIDLASSSPERIAAFQDVIDAADLF